MGKESVRVTQYIRRLRGGSQPILVSANDGLLYVLKFTNNLQGPNLPFNECIGTELYRACKLPVPPWKQLQVTESFLDQNPNCWIETPEGYLRPRSGLCFGSLYLGADRVRLLEILPGTSFKRVRGHARFWLAWLIDICAEHADHRQVIFREDGTGWLEPFFVDHGHLFGGPKGELQRPYQASRYLDPRIYQRIASLQIQAFLKVVACFDVDQLWRKTQTLPEEWKTQSALNGFVECICRLSTPLLLRNILDTMVEFQWQSKESAHGIWQPEQFSQVSVLRSGVQTPEFEQRPVASCAYGSNRA